MSNSKKKLSCQITGCKRSRKKSHELDFEWICSKHWAAIPKKRRKFYYLIKRRYKAGKITNHRYWLAWQKIKGIAHDNAWSV